MSRRIGWLALAALSGLGLVVSAVAGAYAVGLSLSASSPFGVIASAIQTVLVVAFWRWIGFGAWLRAYPPIGEDGLPVREPEPVGPWGVVGRMMLGLMVVGFGAVTLWGALADQTSTREAERVAAGGERAAKSAGLTRESVQAAQSARLVWLGDGPDPLTELLSVEGATVVDASLTDDGAAILLRPDDGPPCAVVTIDVRELIRSRVTDDCG